MSIVTRWPGAILRLGRLTSEQLRDGVVVERHEEECWEARPGRGTRQRYDFAPHAACWRVFAETLKPEAEPDSNGVAAYDKDRLLRFIRRYGVLSRPDNPDENFGYVWLACQLRTLAGAWTDDGERSVAAGAEAGDQAWRRAGFLLQHWAPSAATLRDRMVRAAIGHLAAGVAMRRCDGCGNWLILDPPQRRHCTSACRARVFQQRARAEG